ncbi:putative ScnB-like protein [Rubrobacter xylanophilus DSM 9941]|uniref:Putative ScnB-like protein n=1 Tax=Rubrobacter xylanophilus (strain DSM 9941 / JCM 11954 / NBRC 16129 / PRD-1) TaxID=266117 RepID=Q1ATN6_RUBXD|nr:SH3-like domain-containing protein [Rubrobacter xylanophilus]ABG05242.1 putative ScnB-like protein [Rubrobacter xylanophilus DSM 9941]
MERPHDLGGEPAGPVDRREHEVEDWERLTDAITIALDRKGVKTTDEHRRAIESLPDYRELSYYERWAAATENLLVEKGLLSRKEIDARAEELSRAWGER